MNKLLQLFFIVFITASAIAQENYNLELLANVELGESGNDIWGYVDNNGTEYAVIGSRNGTSVFSLEDPTNPILRYKADGTASTWRDIKSYKDKLYVTCDSGADGLAIIDMSGAPDNISHELWKPIFPALDSTTTLQKTHNLYIDPDGYLYLSGSNISNRGIIILDLNQDPELPVYVGAANIAYSHDVYVQDNLMVTSEIYEGVFGLYDVTDKTNPLLINTQETTTQFTHNGWFSSDNNYVYTTDEKPNAYVESYDISDRSNIKMLDRFQPIETKGLGVIPHNTHWQDGFLITSWYTDGIIILDANKPDNLVEVGSYDTFLGPDGDFNGCWGAYPFLPSGIVLGSDLNSGLYILRPIKSSDGSTGYNRACYLEGTITSKLSGETLSGATVEIVSAKLNEEVSNQNGEYKTGLAGAGSYTVNITHPSYLPFTAEVVLENGEVTILDAELEQFLVAGNTLRSLDDTPLAQVQLSFYNPETNVYVDITSDNNGDFLVGLQPNTNYELFGGSWGFKNFYLDYQSENTNPLIIKLDNGYQDDFNVDLGWTVNGNASTGMWERAVPNGTIFDGDFANPGTDDPDDNGYKCFVTGNIGGDAPTDDIDNGNTILTSPIMDFEGMDSLTIQYKTWFVNVGGSGVPNDTLIIYLSNGTDQLRLETIKESNPTWSDLKLYSLTNDDILFTNQMRLIAYAADDAPGHLAEGALDAFAAEGFKEVSGTSDILSESLLTYPNPVNDILYFDNKEIVNITVQDINGKVLFTHRNNGNNTINLSSLNHGVYLVRFENNEGQSYINKIVKK
jgi:choice-of-anchor B domain-containing protein